MKILIISALAAATGYILDFLDIYDPVLSEPLYIIGTSVFIPALIVIWIKKSELSKLWNKVTYIWLALSILLIVLTPTSSNTWMPLYSINKEGVTWAMAVLFVILSFALIGWKALSRKQK